MQPPPVADPTPEQMLRRLDWAVLRPLDGLLQGDYRTLLRGAGVDFSDLREYQPDDDARFIDWNVTARMDAPYVREYLEDRDLTAWMLLDRSPSMSFGLKGRPKGRVMVELVMALTRLLTLRGNRVGAILYDDVVERTLAPRSDRTHALRLAQHLLAPPAPGRRAETDLTGLVRAGMQTIKRRSLVFLISDFMSKPGWERALPMLASRHDVVAVRLWDPSELELPNVGTVAIEDSETGEQLLVDTSDPRLRTRFAEVARAREEQLASTFRRARVDPFALSTEEDLVTALVRLAGQRKRRTR